MELFTSNRHLLFALVVVAQIFLIVRIWRLPGRGRRAMLLAYLTVALVQSAAGTWYEAVRANSNQPFTSMEMAVAYGLLLLRPLDWALCFAVVHECLNAYLTPYRALHSVGRRVFRAGVVAAAALVLSSVLIVPSEAMGVLSFMYRLEPTLIYGSALALIIVVGLFIRHFELSAAANDGVMFGAVFLIFSLFTLISAAGQLWHSQATFAVLGGVRVALAAPILAIAALRLSTAGEMLPARSASSERVQVRHALESLNTSLERVVKL